MSDIEKIKGHPGFMPIWSANVKGETSNTQSNKDKTENSKEEKSDNSLKK